MKSLNQDMLLSEVIDIISINKIKDLGMIGFALLKV